MSQASYLHSEPDVDMRELLKLLLAGPNQTFTLTRTELVWMLEQLERSLSGVRDA